MQAVAKLSNCPTSPRKMRLVADMIRGRKVDEALHLLKFNNRQVLANYMEKTLLSALSNWNQKNEGARMEDADLIVKEVRVDGGRTIKRLRYAPQGRGHRMVRRSNHITIVVDSLNTEK